MAVRIMAQAPACRLLARDPALARDSANPMAFFLPGLFATGSGALEKSGNAAIIRISGQLSLNSDPASMEVGTTYTAVMALLDQAVADENCDEIIVPVNSPGGEVTGMLEAAEKLRSVAQVKPVTAVVETFGMSAAYVLISGATNILVDEFAQVGSLGAVIEHVDKSPRDAREGDRYTFITAGQFKADGNEHRPLSDRMRAEYQDTVDRVNARLAETVAAGRPALTVDGIMAMQAASFRGYDAVSMGLADEIGTLSQVVSAAPSAMGAASLGADSDPAVVEAADRRRETYNYHTGNKGRSANPLAGSVSTQPGDNPMKYRPSSNDMKNKGKEPKQSRKAATLDDNWDEEALNDSKNTYPAFDEKSKTGGTQRNPRGMSPDDEALAADLEDVRRQNGPDIESMSDEDELGEEGTYESPDGQSEWDNSLGEEGTYESPDGQSEWDDDYEGDVPNSRSARSRRVRPRSSADLQRMRIAAIMQHPAARGRQKLAQYLAFQTGMLPSAAIGTLKAAPRASAAVPRISGAGVGGAATAGNSTARERGRAIGAAYRAQVLGQKPKA